MPPCSAHRCALEGAEKARREEPSYNENADDVDSKSQVGKWKDSSIEEEDRYLDEGYGQCVQLIADEEGLESALAQSL